MKKILPILAVLGFAAGGLWWMIHRDPGLAPPDEIPEAAFALTPDSGGVVIRHQNPPAPLRALRRLQPLPGGWVVIQIVTQSDRQQVTLFKDGLLRSSHQVPKPIGVRDGFFRLAELREARVVGGDVAVLLFSPPDRDSPEPSLVIALDLNTNTIRWFHRAFGEHLAAGDPQLGVVYLYGSKTPPVRLPLALTDDERNSASGARSVATVIELAPEILEISELRPTGSRTLLLAHKGGLSAYLGSKGWVHHPLPENKPDCFKDFHGVLSGGPKTYWWQPFPGMLLQVLMDGAPKSTWSPKELLTAEPFAKDAYLLHFLGTDAAGKLWFDLSIPSETQVNSHATIEPSSQEASDPPAGSSLKISEPLEDWQPYLNQGLDRLYCWDAEHNTLRRLNWLKLSVPEGFKKPVNGVKFSPDSGVLMLENDSSSWLLPMPALPLGEPSSTLPPNQAK
jgi:hypothetical protein